MKRFGIVILSLLFLFVAAPAKAACPICTIAVGAGLGFSRWLGIDDTITAVWVGGLLASVTAWTINWLENKKITFFARNTIIAIFWYAITLVPLWKTGIIGHPLNVLWGVDKIILGTIAGTIIFIAGSVLYNYLKKKNNNKAHFPFEKVAIPVVCLGIMSTIFYFITR